MGGKVGWREGARTENGKGRTTKEDEGGNKNDEGRKGSMSVALGRRGKESEEEGGEWMGKGNAKRRMKKGGRGGTPQGKNVEEGGRERARKVTQTKVMA